MSKRHGNREQKRLAKQKAKRSAKRQEQARRESRDPTIRLKNADRWPVAAALVPADLWTNGVGILLIARSLPDGRLACAQFLVDVFCLGVKDAHWSILTAGEFNSTRKRVAEHGPLQEMPPEYFAKLVYRTADYGQSLGFPPHRDFRHAQRLLAGIDPSRCPDEFEFGQDGRPFYVRGPHESPEKARSIADRVNALGGHYVISLGSDDAPPDLFDLEDEAESEYDDLDVEEDGCDDDDWEAPDAEDGERPRRWSWLPWH